MTYQLFIGNNLEILPTLPDNSVDSIVTDPPYGLSDNKYVAETIARWIAGERDFVPDGKGFMGKSWDAFVPPPALWDQCLRVLKPGGHLLSFFGSRTQDIGALAIRLAGFEIRDSIAWLYGSGFPKSLNLTGEWQGWGTALKPALEPIVVARKPIEGTVANNVLKWGTGGLNIDASRINNLSEKEKNWTPQRQHSENPIQFGGARSGDVVSMYKEGGRWPANIILDPYTAELLDEQSGDRPGGNFPTQRGIGVATGFGAGKPTEGGARKMNDSGGASRFFYIAKTSKRDRNDGLDTLPEIQTTGGGGLTANLREDGSLETASAGGKYGSIKAKQTNFHPTVKPTMLMEYLIKLVTPPNGTVLDPFTGSGSTGKAAILNGFSFIGIEMTQDYVPIIEGRLKHAEKTVAEAKEQETLEETEKLF